MQYRPHAELRYLPMAEQASWKKDSEGEGSFRLEAGRYARAEYMQETADPEEAWNWSKDVRAWRPRTELSSSSSRTTYLGILADAGCTIPQPYSGHTGVPAGLA